MAKSAKATARKMAEVRERSKLSKEEWREYTKTVWHIANVSNKDHPAVFPEEIPRRLIKLFSFVGDTVLDPFGGVGTTGKVALDLERNAICVDQNPRYVELTRQMGAAPLLSTGKVKAVHGDSRELNFLGNDSVQLIVTSPPYWDKADYGRGSKNLGAITSYVRFLDEIETVFAECFRVLEPGRKMCLVTANVNQHTDYGLLTFPLATDFLNRLRNVGFVLINEIIWSKDGTGGRWGSWGTQRPIFGSYPYPPNFLFKNVHEYIVVVAKPPRSQSKGPKVRKYTEIMSR